MNSEEITNQSNPSSSNNVNVSFIPDVISPAMPILKEIYTDVASPSVKKVGIALETVLDFGYTFLFAPLQHVSDKKKLNTQKNLDMYKKKVEVIPEQDIAEVEPELGIPIIQKLTYVKNEDIADLFTTLLASASSVKTCSLAHPGFIKIIENLSADEANILKYLADNKIDKLPFITINAIKDTAQANFTSRLTGIDKKEELGLLFPENDHLYFDNLMSLGLLEISGTYLLDEKIYKDLEESYIDMKVEIEELLKEEPTAKINIEKGYYRITYYAEAFFKACM